MRLSALVVSALLVCVRLTILVVLTVVALTVLVLGNRAFDCLVTAQLVDVVRLRRSHYLFEANNFDAVVSAQVLRSSY